MRTLLTPYPRTDSGTMLIADHGAGPNGGVVLDFVIISSVPVPANIISWWPAGGDAQDAVSSSNGVMTNGVTFVAGKVGQSFRFDGTNQEVLVASSASLNPTAAITLEGWIMPTRYPANDGVSIFGKDNAGNARQYLLSYANVSSQWVLRPCIGMQDGLHYFNDTTPLYTNIWYHVCTAAN